VASQTIEEFDKRNVIGDLLWQPINKQGIVDLQAVYRVTTLMDLSELPKFIGDGGSVLLVMGCSGISRIPKSELLKAILELNHRHPWVTDVVTDSPTAEGINYPHARPNIWQESR
jgi:hypothetical protein